MDSTIVAAIIGAIATVVAGVLGFFVGYNKKITQAQKARDNVNQVQIGDIDEKN